MGRMKGVRTTLAASRVRNETAPFTRQAPSNGLFMKRMMGLNLFTQAGLGQTQREFETGPFRTQLSDFKATTSQGATTDPAALRRAKPRCLAGQQLLRCCFECLNCCFALIAPAALLDRSYCAQHRPLAHLVHLCLSLVYNNAITAIMQSCNNAIMQEMAEEIVDHIGLAVRTKTSLACSLP